MSKIILNYDDYRNKVLGCWMGKNIGGTLGAPMEWKRQVNNVTFYTQELYGEPLPNDDLDLQLVWLLALERFGPAVDSHVLAQYWLQYIVPHWVEYGVAKTNLSIGLMPPVSGWYGNIYKDSCGAFIRSEIWACIAPGCPNIAAKYAYEDAIVDHADEGVYAAVFCAVVESAAFVEQDRFRLIELGLSALPFECGVARGIRTAVEAYKQGKDWLAAREAVLSEVPSIPEGYIGKDNATSTGYDAPNNIAFMVIGWLYGEEDFGESLCITVNCGDDTDCTAATLGAIFGIIHGIDGLPSRWKDPIGRKINTVAINVADETRFPKSIDELTGRVMRLAQQVLLFNNAECEIRRDLHTDLSTVSFERILNVPEVKRLLSSSRYEYVYDFGAFKAFFSYEGNPTVRSDTVKRLKISLEKTMPSQQIIEIRWIFSDECFGVSPSNVGLVFVFSDRQEIEVELEVGKLTAPWYRGFVEIVHRGTPTVGVVPFVLLNDDYGTTPYRMKHVKPCT
jgi:ADP-ribosylglycohydrolase